MSGCDLSLSGSEVWHPACKQAARAARKLRVRRMSETSISPPESSISSPSRVICVSIELQFVPCRNFHVHLGILV